MMVRYGMINRDKAIDLVKLHDHDLDPRTVREFCRFAGYTEKEFWAVVEKFYNQEIFEKKITDVTWQLKNPLWEN